MRRFFENIAVNLALLVLAVFLAARLLKSDVPSADTIPQSEAFAAEARLGD